MNIKIEKTFIGSSGIPLTLFCVNNENPVSFAKRFFKTGFKENDNFVIKDNSNYRGKNIVWQAMMDAKPEDIRKYCRNSIIFGHTKNLRDDNKGTWKWDPIIKLNLIAMIRSDIAEFLQKGIELEVNGLRGTLNANEGAYHFVGMDWIKEAYIQCYNEDNGIKEGCFVTTAVCNSLSKSDDCFELTAFRKFRDEWLTAQPDGKTLIAEYYAIAPRIVANINHLADAKEIYKHIWQKYLAPCLNFIERGDNDSCKSKYVEMVCELKKQYS